ncbi:unnamed protein product [Nezara viridula]|uniref:ATP synthase mitochondrial F1 complex assembly factor 1 n=1 Tax=Nezara viridula TaxID=85310 RepID=A0A9P0H8B9_NEZVI|nr:unnamed protein product [Nezara viridula]
MAVVFRRHFQRIILNSRKIMTTGFDLNKAKDDLESNPYFNKYADKIRQIQNADPEEFLKKLKACQEKNKEIKVETKKVVYGDKKSPSVSQVKQTRKLDEIMKTSLLENKSKEEIISIWNEFHKGKNVVYGTLTSDAYRTIRKYGEKYVTFLLPLPRGEGYEFIMLQFENNEVHFTPLISYQTHKADAPECLTVVYYADLSETKDVVLMKGEFDKNILSSVESQCLINQLHLYYGENDDKRIRQMDTFNNNPDSFRYMDLIAEMDLIPLKSQSATKK